MSFARSFPVLFAGLAVAAPAVAFGQPAGKQCPPGTANPTYCQTVTTGATKRDTPKIILHPVARPKMVAVTGTLVLPSDVHADGACSGRVTVVLRQGNRTLGRVVTRVNGHCEFLARINAPTARRGVAKLQAIFAGNHWLAATAASPVTLRLG